jgi:hypothetical protein
LKRWYDDLKQGDHAAHIYHSTAEQARVVMDMISWMGEDERLVLLSDRWDGDVKVRRSRLINAALEDGHLEIVSSRPTLCPSGKFRADMLGGIMGVEVERAFDDGRSGLVLMWDLEWLGKDANDFEAHIVQQASMALSPRRKGLTIIGQYGFSDFSLQQVERIARVNPLVLEDGLLTRQFWVVAHSTMGRPGGRRTLQIDAPNEGATGTL